MSYLDYGLWQLDDLIACYEFDPGRNGVPISGDDLIVWRKKIRPMAEQIADDLLR